MKRYERSKKKKNIREGGKKVSGAWSCKSSWNAYCKFNDPGPLNVIRLARYSTSGWQSSEKRVGLRGMDFCFWESAATQMRRAVESRCLSVLMNDIFFIQPRPGLHLRPAQLPAWLAPPLPFSDTRWIGGKKSILGGISRMRAPESVPHVCTHPHRHRGTKKKELHFTHSFLVSFHFLRLFLTRSSDKLGGCEPKGRLADSALDCPMAN